MLLYMGNPTDHILLGAMGERMNVSIRSSGADVPLEILRSDSNVGGVDGRCAPRPGRIFHVGRQSGRWRSMQL